MKIIDFLDKQSSAIFGGIGALFGFFSTYWLKKLDHKYEITKDESKEYFKEKRTVLGKILQYISDYETELKTLHDFIENENGQPIRELKQEDVFEKYFLLIFEYLHSHRFYLNNETIKKLDELVDLYHSYKLDIKVIKSELPPEIMFNEITKRKQKLFIDAQVLFNELKEQIKFGEIKNFKTKLEIK